MSTATATEAVTIRLETGCDHAECAETSWTLYKQLSGGKYDVCSVMALPDTIDEWREEHRTARKRADRASRRGYRFIDVVRHERAEEIQLINMSTNVRQGRPMSPGYSLPPSRVPDPTYPCPRHGVHPYGVEEPEGTLIAYLWSYRSGALSLVSQILGHAEYLKDEVMFLLWQGMLERELGEPGYAVYNRHDSGGDGLRFYKERVGLTETPVEWQR